ncbi:YqaI-like protein [Melghiribacillus thermohalophilus]|uniref:YqaI-like protein n=1 Tax=Melghiribacillus thermohalophilus TaxID=1324956 RepID=A0A4V2V222_9BACI|nr:hypothetical protein [Melghiribacillus thermohalophilus]TCT23362.1 YqaI-like protein [Melghiribacillus thermohalophilus]
MSQQSKEIYGIDALGNEVFKGETILIHGKEFFLKDALKEEALELLERLGAVETKA